MPLLHDMVGTSGAWVTETLEDRWVMNYAASVFDRNPGYFDNRVDRALPAHPAYLSHLEWEAISSLHEVMGALEAAERRRGVHSFNDTQIIRPLRSGDEIRCRSTVVGIERRRTGGRLTIQTDTVDSAGAPVASSLTRTVFRGIDVIGEDVVPDSPPIPEFEIDSGTARSEHIEIDTLAAHIFSECARDYSPIHTDIKVATEAELPGLILHGTGTFALVLSSLVNHEGQGDPTRVRRFSGRLGAMVLCPSTARLEVVGNGRNYFRFELAVDDTRRAIGGGFLELA